MVGNDKIRIYVAENLHFELDLTVRLLNSYPDVHVVGKNHLLPRAIEEICSMEPPPNVVFMDIDFNLRNMDGLSALAAVKRHNKKIRVIMITIHDTPELPALAF